MEEECCVLGCPNTEDNEEVLFHKFPRNSDFKGIWMKAIPLKTELCEVPLICSDHFPDTDYKDIKGKKILNRLAIPSIFDINPKDIDSNCNNKENSNNKDSKPNEINSEKNKINEEAILTDKSGERHINDTESKTEILNKDSECLDKSSIVKDCDVLNRIEINKKVNGITEEANKIIKEKSNELDLEDTIPSFVILDHNPIPRGNPLDDERPIDVDVQVVQDVAECDIERVEVSIDPSSLMIDMPIDEIELSDGECEVATPCEPVSLLTSSDEDEVIFQEPHYDIVDVSDETDEEDRPLVTLVSRPRASKLNQLETNIITNIIKKVNEFNCVICQFRTDRRSKFFEHVDQHSGSVQKCFTCNFKSGSVTEFKKHLNNHTKEKRFQCHLCSFKARHHMSLVYHLQDHVVYSCKKCTFRTFDSADLVKHTRGHSAGSSPTADPPADRPADRPAANSPRRGKHVCQKCNKCYKTKLGLRKHRRKHYEDDE